jgi:hypothetical protein
MNPTTHTRHTKPNSDTVAYILAIISNPFNLAYCLSDTVACAAHCVADN